MKRKLLVFLTISLCLIIGPSHNVHVMAWNHVISEDAWLKETNGNLDRLKLFIISDRAFVDTSSTNFSVPQAGKPL